jgi:acetyl esterase/lipase
MCSGDLYLPKKKEGPYPLVIVVHAGGWMTGDKNDFDSAELCIKLAIVGFAAYNINYRLVADGGTFPHSIDDVKDAVNFMAAHGQDYDIDPQKIALFGISAGANLSLIAAYNPDQDLPNGQKDNHLRVPIRAVVAYCPVIDLTTLDKPFVAKYMGDIPSHAAELYRQASPAAYVKTAVPTICIHGTGDTLIPYTESKKFVALLEKNGRQAKFVAVPDAVHLFVGGDKDLSFKPAVEFLGARFQ